MIKSEVKAANKSLRIYRPDISLDDICRTNGAAIVRAMVPCFNFPEKVNSEKYFRGNKYPHCSFVYGVNVRTSRLDRILPFSTAYIYDKEKKEGRIHDSLGISPESISPKVPEFTDKYRIREIFLSVDIRDGKILPENVIIMSLTTDEKLKRNKKINELNELLKDICKETGFFSLHIKALKIKKRAFLWLTSEDYCVNTAGSALSNIIAISDDFDAIESYIKPRRLDFINLLFLIKARYMFDTEIAQRKTAIASAKAAIMSRNMSHNLGSHVMAYLKQHLNSVQDMVHDNVLNDILKSENDNLTLDGIKKLLADIINDDKKTLDEVALPFLVGLGKFISYLQERQDFIATIATNYIPYFSTVSFKDGVYDELNPDLRYERHKDRKGLKPDNILLGNIARSEGLARSTMPTKNKQSQMSDIVLKYKDFEGKPIMSTLNGKEVPLVENWEQQNKDLKDMRDFMISLPGGVVGRQAIFSIVENVIRNAAKHGKWGNSSNKNLELTFSRYYLEDLKDIKDDYVPEGDISFPAFFERYYAYASDINDLCVITLTDNMSFELHGTSRKKCEHLDAINNALIEPYIDNVTVEMLQTNKGIKEMRISAAWMRGIDDDVKINPLYITSDYDCYKLKDEEDHWIKVFPSNDEEKKDFEYKYWAADKKHWVGKAPVLMARACANKEGEDYHLQYIFCVPRPKKVAIILSPNEYENWIEGDGERILNDFAKNAWGIYSVDSFIAEKNKSYEFILISSGVNQSDIAKIQQLSPKRVYTQDKIKEIIELNESTLTKDFCDFESVYVALYRILCGFNENDKIVIDDKTAKMSSEHKDELKDYLIIEPGASFNKGKYLYKTHNETEQLFAAFLKAIDETKEEIRFVEGITGNNSTDRLIRNEKIDELWMYKHLHAMKTSVGIFDERIFSKIYKKDEADIRLMQLPFDDLKQNILKTIPDSKEDLYKKMDVEDAKTEEELISSIGYHPREVLGDYISIAYQMKGVSVFNILKTNNGMEIYGYGGYKWVEIEIGNEKRKKCYSIIEKIGEITFTKDGHFKISNFRNLKFDYLSIHQGLLDKIYEMFDIRSNAAEKHEFTKAFYCAFCSDGNYLIYEDKMIPDPANKEGKEVYFLPNLCIHSGRSKPSFADMPQHQPFIQYAAIEHAVLDCKYSLVELLDFARYE